MLYSVRTSRLRYFKDTKYICFKLSVFLIYPDLTFAKRDILVEYQYEYPYNKHSKLTNLAID
jgi:hypothetical protein